MTTVTKTPRANLNLEALEERSNPSNVHLQGGELHIHGTVFNDSVTVSQTWFGYQVADHMTGLTYNVAFGQVPTGKVMFEGNLGNDYFRNNAPALSVVAYGGTAATAFAAFGIDGNDMLIGGSNADVLYGGTGHDSLYGMRGYDRLYGGAGNDYLDAALDGNIDYLQGGTGMDSFKWNLGDFIADFKWWEGDRRILP